MMNRSAEVIERLLENMIGRPGKVHDRLTEEVSWDLTDGGPFVDTLLERMRRRLSSREDEGNRCGLLESYVGPTSLVVTGAHVTLSFIEYVGSSDSLLSLIADHVVSDLKPVAHPVHFRPVLILVRDDSGTRGVCAEIQMYSDIDVQSFAELFSS